MKVLKVKTGEPYEIIIEKGLFSNIPLDLKENLSFGKVAIITDSNVERLYAHKLLSLLEKEGIRAKVFSFPAGEASKNIDTVITLARRMIQERFDRKDLILALGGGVVGDIAGFLASIYLRGIPFVQIPTTLLAQVDSSVGGKTGVDLPEGKNLIGTFYQPKRVYIDPDVLKTLPLAEVKNGLAEVVKYGCILKKRLFDFLKKLGEKVYDLGEELEYIIYESCRAKAWVVSKDEREGGLRRILNFGHTVGHAIETYLDYSVPHGMAVAVGMVAEAMLSEKLGVVEKSVVKPLVSLLKKLGLPYKLSDLGNIDPEALPELMTKDKKVWKGKLTIVLLKKIGKACFYESPPFDVVLEVLKEVK
ncbi:MAG: 3-dehydroquinate synthase, partial [Thermodesulfobacteria bacterium]|nr:3-dehydroquinate synthase [Thermodesulfobacteriota bacterium]